MNRTWLWIIFIVLGLALGAELGYYYYWPKNTGGQAAATNQENVATSATPSVNPTVQAATVSDPGVTWIEPKKLDDLKLVKTNDDIASINDYYQIANLQDGGRLILVTVAPNNPGGDEILRFRQDKAGKYTYLLKHSAEQDTAVINGFLADSKAMIDFETSYQSISAPDYLTVGSATFKKAGRNSLFSDWADSKPVEVATTSYGKLYKTPVSTVKSPVGPILFNLKLSDSSSVSYAVKVPFQPDDEVSQISWSDGVKNTAKYTPEGYISCGSYGSDNVVLDATNISARLTEAGQTTTGDKIYTAKASDSIVKSAYENYKVGRDNNVLTIDQFLAKKPVFVWHGPLDTYVIFTGRDFAGLAECGKPVIYLYPTQETQVSLKLGVNITKSEPVYNNGWQVTAKPSGELTVGDKTYNSLYWEGTGQVYPQINQGFVVARADLESTLKDQVAKLGLNEKESADFMAFWLPKMPKTSYVRLTWFGTKDVNNLAPLTITPKPDTIIRIFLDFQGLNSPITLKPQVLTSIPRQGFTVIEWGGLLK